MYHTVDCCKDHGTRTRQASSELAHIGAALTTRTQEAGVSIVSGVSSNVDPPSDHQAVIQRVLQCKLGSTGAGYLHSNFLLYESWVLKASEANVI